MRIFARTRTGVAAALGSAVLFGGSTPFAKALLGEVSPWLMAGLLYLGVGIGLGALRLVTAIRAGQPGEAPLRRGDLGWLAAIVLFGGVAGPLLLMVGLTYTPAASAALLLNLEGLATLGIAWLVYRENVDLRIGIGAAAILLGAMILSWQGGIDGLNRGSLAIAAACLCWGIDNNLTRKLSAADPVQIATIKGLVAGIVNVGLALSVGSALPDGWRIAQAMTIGLVGYGISLVLFIHGLRHLGAARTGAYFSLAPFMGAAVAVFAFGDAMTPQLGIAAGLMGIGLYLHLAERHEHDHHHKERIHEHAHSHDIHHQHDHAPADPPGEPHVHLHRHAPMIHRHPHFPDIHHRHRH
ncbi:EamA family transporter [Ferrovibrio terrae]|uniref:DMT family transporter n=1 Tax=Ferrovibrio terrae TaxID=2594003 RepID=UPI0031378066